MPNYIYDITNIQLNPNTYTNTEIEHLNLRNVPWVNNSMYNAFSNCTNIITVSNIERNVVNIAGTFSECYKLEAVNDLPDTCDGNLTNTFRNCRSLVDAPRLPANCTELRSDLSYTFVGCSNLVQAPIIPDWVDRLNGTFSECRNLTSVPTIPNSITSMESAFSYCTSLINAPTIPNSVTSLAYCFSACQNLTNIPALPASITNLTGTFSGCASLTNLPVLPISITALPDTFKACTNLINININSISIINLYQTFKGCTNITNAAFRSNQITNITNCFADTTTAKNVYIPFYNTYTNKENTITYDTCINAGYDEIGTKDGVYLKTLTPVLTINPTPADATVRLEVEGIQYAMTDIAVPYNTNVDWTVSAPNYTTRTGTQLVSDSNIILDVDLNKITYTLTVTPTPSEAMVRLECGTQIVEGTGTQSITVEINSEVTYTVSAEDYISQTGTMLMNSDASLQIELEEDGEDWAFDIDSEQLATLTLYLGNETEVEVPDIVYGIPEGYSDEYSFVLNNNMADLTKYTGNETDIIVPDYVIEQENE